MSSQVGIPDDTRRELASRLSSVRQSFLTVIHTLESVAVKEGDRVEEGDLLGKCGNSGHTSEPHLHIHHQRQRPNLHVIGLAEGLPLYFRKPDGKSWMPEGQQEPPMVIRNQ